MPATGDRITKRKDGLYMARYTVQTPDGPKRKTIYGKRYKDVREKLTEAMTNADKGLLFDAENLKVGEYLDRWLKDSVRGSVKPVTYESYARLARIHLKPAVGQVKLKNLAPAHLQGLYRDKLDAGLSPRTVQYIHVVLHRALKQALRWGMLPRNPSEAVDPPRNERQEMRPLSPEEARTFLQAASTADDRLEALYVLAVHTGLRQGELLGLKWKDVDIEAGTLQVRRTLTRTKGEYKLQTPKTAKSRRRIKLPTGAMKALKKHRKRQLQEKLRAGPLWEDNGLVFTTERGTPVSRQNMSRRSFKPLLKRAELPDIRFHDLRHTCATLLLSKGVHVKYVQELLGHATIAITLDTYSHVLPGMDDGLTGAMDDALRG